MLLFQETQVHVVLELVFRVDKFSFGILPEADDDSDCWIVCTDCKMNEACDEGHIYECLGDEEGEVDMADATGCLHCVGCDDSRGLNNQEDMSNFHEREQEDDVLHEEEVEVDCNRDLMLRLEVCKDRDSEVSLADEDGDEEEQEDMLVYEHHSRIHNNLFDDHKLLDEEHDEGW